MPKQADSTSNKTIDQMQGSTKLVHWLCFSGLIILLDQISKLWILAKFQFGEVLPVTSFLNLLLTYNPGAAFSFLAGAGGWQKWFFTALAVGISAWIIAMLRQHPAQKFTCTALSLIMGGALGNVIDRLAYGAVVDFLDFYVGTWHWPAFNVADSAICVGAAMMVWEQFFLEKRA